MTRGTFFLYTPTKVYETNEFNGDMYFEGHGEDAAIEIMKVKTSTELLNLAKKFNKKYFRYEDEYVGIRNVARVGETYEKYLDMSEDYFKKFFSDYIFIKNESGSELRFILEDKTEKILPNHTSGVLNFGRDAKSFYPEINAFLDTEGKYGTSLDEDDGLHEITVTVYTERTLTKKIRLTDEEYDWFVDNYPSAEVDDFPAIKEMREEVDTTQSKRRMEVKF